MDYEFYPSNPAWLPILQQAAITPAGESMPLTELPPGIDKHPDASDFTVYRYPYLTGGKAVLAQVRRRPTSSCKKTVLGYWLPPAPVADGFIVQCANPAYVEIVRQAAVLPRGKALKLDVMPEGIERIAPDATAVVQRLYYKDDWFRAVVRQYDGGVKSRKETVLGWFRNAPGMAPRALTPKRKKPETIEVAGVTLPVIKCVNVPVKVAVLKDDARLPIPVWQTRIHELPVDVIRQPTVQAVARCLRW